MDEKVVLTPHLGASTQEAQMKVGIAMAEQVIEFANNGVVSNAVNMPSMSNEVLNEISPYINLCEKSFSSLQSINFQPRAPETLRFEKMILLVF